MFGKQGRHRVGELLHVVAIDSEDERLAVGEVPV